MEGRLNGVDGPVPSKSQTEGRGEDTGTLENGMCLSLPSCGETLVASWSLSFPTCKVRSMVSPSWIIVGFQGISQYVLIPQSPYILEEVSKMSPG